MPVSGSKDYAVTRSDIIESALRKVGVYDQGESVPGDENKAAILSFNLMVKALTARGADLFLREEMTLFLQKNQSSYLLGTSAEAANTYVETSLTAAASSGATTLTVSSTSGMTGAGDGVADRIGIKMDDDTIHWTTISSVTSSTGLQIATAIDDDAASGNKVYTYSTRAGRPAKLVYAYRRDTSGLDTEVDLIGENEYQRLSNKDSDGAPTQVWYRPSIDIGTLHVWPTNGGSSTDKLVMVVNTYPDDMDVASNNPEFPIEWGEALTYSLADRLAPEYGLSWRERRELKAESEFHLNNMLDWDVENSDVVFTMGR